MSFYYIHSALMFIGFIFMIIGVFSARFLKKMKWWLKLHKTMNIIGALSTIIGIALMTSYISYTGSKHFNHIHSYLGFFVGFLSVITPLIGFVQLKALKSKIKFRPIHRFLGRLLIISMIFNILLGLRFAGII